MLELIMTRPKEKQLIERASGLRFIVLDELHTYRGRQGADVALLMRRVRNRLETSEHDILFVGTSATLASQGSYVEQQAQIAAVGTQIFGVNVKPENVIGETLRRATPEKKSGNVAELRQTASKGKDVQAHEDYQAFVNHPFSAWIEDTFGLQEREGRLARQEPKSIHEAAAQLSQLIGVPKEKCAESIERWLLAGYSCSRDPNTGRAPFAFRLHQFISPADTVYATIEREAERYLTLHRQHYVPGDRDKVLFPLCFCRECGQEYYTVRLTRASKTDVGDLTPRDFNDYLSDDTSEAGYIYIGSHNPWDKDHENIIRGERLPDDWLENHKGSLRIRATRRDKMPRHMRVMPSGEQQADGLECVYVSAPFMFCLNCGVSYSARQGDFGKLATLSSEGRSSATTLLSLSAIRSLKKSDLPAEAQKLLSFTDNRQDASLQAGHFNDFIEVCLLRAAIYRAVKEGGEEGLTHDVVAQKVFDALGLPFKDYASDPSVAEGFSVYDKTQQALRMVLGYRIYRDLRRGWRIALPNLEQCGLLEIKYTDLDTICAAQDIWQGKQPALETASPQTRQQVAKTLLDYMRRELAIKVDYLDRKYQERIQQVSSQHLQAPWAIDEDETMEYASTLMPRASSADRQGGFTYVSARGGFGMYLRRINIFPNYGQGRDKIAIEDTERIIVDCSKGCALRA